MLGKSNLENQVDIYLKQQAKLDEKRKKIIDLFNEEYSKKEVTNLVDYLLENVADTYKLDLEKFIEHYESSDKNAFTIKDIKIYITLLKVHKKHMKEEKSKEKNNDLDTNKEQNELAEGNDE